MVQRKCNKSSDERGSVQVEVILTGTGLPPADPDRAGPGVLVRRGHVTLQFDAGRATTMRLARVGVRPTTLTALFLTHHHSDHTLGMADIVLTRWVEGNDAALPVVAPQGPAATFASRLLDAYADDIEVRREHAGRESRPATEVLPFEATPTPARVWADAAAEVTVSAVAVHHEPVVPAVAYRVDTPEGSVVVSGDTIVCDEVENLARGADVLVHEAMRSSVVKTLRPWQFVLEYHADVTEVGALARRAGVRTLVLTHLLPPPYDEADTQAFADDARAGGFEGDIVVGPDLTQAAFGS